MEFHFIAKGVPNIKININIGLVVILICLEAVNSVVMKIWISYIFNITDLKPIYRKLRISWHMCTLLSPTSSWHSFTKSPGTTEQSRYYRSVTRHLAFLDLSVRGFPFNLGIWSPPACPTRKWMRLSWRRPFLWGGDKITVQHYTRRPCQLIQFPLSSNGRNAHAKLHKIVIW
jgi:hypothetical protein